MIKPITYILNLDDFKRLKKLYPNMRNNHDIGNFGVEVVKLYLESKGASNVLMEVDKIDIQATLNGERIKYEVKSTAKADITFNNLKVSSPKDYKAIKEGMEVLRVCNVGERTIYIYSLKYGRDFDLVEEPRWRLKIK